MAIDQGVPCTLTVDKIGNAVDEGQLVGLLQNSIDDSGAIALWSRDERERAEVESALANAFEAIRGRERKKCGVRDNAFCVVVAIVLEAMQQNFSR